MNETIRKRKSQTFNFTVKQMQDFLRHQQNETGSLVMPVFPDLLTIDQLSLPQMNVLDDDVNDDMQNTNAQEETLEVSHGSGHYENFEFIEPEETEEAGREDTPDAVYEEDDIFMKITRIEENVLSMQQDIKAEMNGLLKKLNHIGAKLSTMIEDDVEDDEVLRDIQLPQLPVSSTEALSHLEKQIKNDKLTCKKFYKKIKTLGGNTLKKQVTAVMSEIMTDEVAVGTTWTGVGKSYEFGETKISKTIMELMIVEYKAKREDTKWEIRRWLTTGGNRIRNLEAKKLLLLERQRELNGEDN